MVMSVLESLWGTILSIPTKKVVDVSLILSVCVWLVILISRKWASTTAKASSGDLEKPTAGVRGKVTRPLGGKYIRMPVHAITKNTR